MLKKIYGGFKRRKNHYFKYKFPRLFAGSTRLSALYYFLFHPGFSREFKGVLAGKVQHLNITSSNGKNYFMLVRNTHRLEKGLLMQPRKPVFALDYIDETMNCFEFIAKDQEANLEEGQLKWSKDVLKEYFSVVDSNQKIDSLKARFEKVLSLKTLQKEDEDQHFIPYERSRTEFSQIDYESFYKLCRQRRSVRWFQEKPVPRELIDKAILAAIEAPSACNRQPFSYRIFDKKDLVDQVSGFPMGTKGYAHSIQSFIVVVGNLEAYFDERDRHLIYIDASLANMTLMFALETLGLGSCPINWPEIESREKLMGDFLSLKAWERPVMCIGVGYPDPEGKVAYSKKRDLTKIRSYNFDVH